MGSIVVSFGKPTSFLEFIIMGHMFIVNVEYFLQRISFYTFTQNLKGEQILYKQKIGYNWKNKIACYMHKTIDNVLM